jgi:glycosyltransferase involved in cell wall biosynthesis
MNHEPEIASGLEFVIIGDGPEKTRIEELDKELETKIVFIPNTPKQKVMRMIKNASGYIVPLKKLNLFLGAIPSKIFDPLALGIPVILGVDGEARNIFIKQGKGGLYYEPENHEAMANAIIQLEKDKELAKKLGQQGKEYVEQNFDRKNIAMSFKDKVQILDS